MKKSNSIDLSGTMAGTIICFLFAVIALLIGVCHVYTKTNFEGDAIYAKAYLCKISHEKMASRRSKTTTTIATIEYSANDRTYRQEFDGPAKLALLGKISVYYDSSNPNKYFSIRAIVFTVVLTALCSTVFFLFAVSNYKTYSEKKEQLF